MLFCLTGVSFSEFWDLCEVDSRPRKLKFALNYDTTIAILPHFWFAAGYYYSFINFFFPFY